MSSTIIPTVGNALTSLGIKLWSLGGEPSNEAEFLSMFKKEMSNNNGVVDYSTNPSDFGVTWSQVKTEQDSLQTAYDAQAYARARQPLYPDIGDQLDDLYHAGVFSAGMIAKLKKVKDDNPK